MSDRLIIRVLAGLCVLLSVIALGSALLAARAHRQTACWKAFVQDGELPPEGDCARLR